MTPLYILPFDHRASFLKIIGAATPAADEDIALARKCKQIIYQGFQQAVKLGMPKEHAAVLVDEWLGEAVLHQAKQEAVAFCFPLEKSSQQEFAHEYTNWQEKLQDTKPAYAKVLIRYNPVNKERNKRQQRQLAALSAFLAEQPTKFLLELLVPPEAEQKVATYDTDVRPQLTVQAIQELYAAQVFPDVWKLEGVNSHEAMQRITDAVALHEDTSIVILGRGQDATAVERWLAIGASSPHSIGFAVGRTVFSDAIQKYAEGTCTEEQAVESIAEKFMHFFTLWIQAKNQMNATSLG